MENLSSTPRNGRAPWLCLIFVLAILFGLGATCGSGIKQDVFEKGHKLKGRYSNSDHGIRRSFTFNEDGTVLREMTSALNASKIDPKNA
ncbi:MAG: hypothetical protein ABIZ95_18340, partial [Pyrinomonadaceae bacterium]